MTPVAVGGSSAAPSPKRARTVLSCVNTTETSGDQGTGGSQTDSARFGKNCAVEKDHCMIENDSPDESVDDQELFLDKLQRENEEKAKKDEGSVVVDCVAEKWMVPYSVGNQGQVGASVDVSEKISVSSAVNVHVSPVGKRFWPSLVTITDVSEESASSVMGSREYTVQSPISPPADDVEQEDTAATRFSSRLQDNVMEDVREKAENLTRKRNLEGNETSTDTNSFASLSNNEIVVRASKMGVRIPDNNFSSIDLLRELECARENIENKHMHSVNDVHLFIENNVGETTPLCMSWADENEGIDDDFILVESKKKKRDKKKGKSPIIAARPITRSQKAVVRDGDKSAHTPGRNIRERKQNSRYK
jgi:hypothetical protein